MDHDYLIHYGIPKRSGRFPWGSGKRPFQSGGGKDARIARKAERINQKANKKFAKVEVRREKYQATANKHFDKAVRRSFSFFSSQNRVNRSVVKGVSAQKKAARLEQKGSRYYKRIQKKMSRMNQKIDPNVQKLGEQYMKYASDRSKSLYNTMIVTDKMMNHYRT